MTKDLDARGPAGRTEAIIPLIRETFGDDMALYADANGYYKDVNEAIRVGKLLQGLQLQLFRRTGILRLARWHQTGRGCAFHSGCGR